MEPFWHSRLASVMTAASWKALRSALENEDWNSIVSTLLDELHCHSEHDLVSILRATIDEAHRRQEHKGRKGGKDKGKGKEKGRGSYTFTIDVDNVDTSFGMLAKLVGNNGENVHHIQDVTKAKVWINREAGQPTAIEISADSRDSLDQAKQLADGLLSAMYDEYDSWADENGISPRPKKCKGKRSGGKSKGKGSMDGKKGAGFVKHLELEEFDPAFNIRGKLIGEKGRNVRHIQDASITNVKIYQVDNEGPISVTVSGGKEGDVGLAIKLCKDLVHTVKQEYEAWMDAGGASREESSGKAAPEEGDYTGKIEVDKTDAAFDMKGKIIGDKGKHVHHVQDETGAKVWVDQTAKGEPITVRISAGSQENVDSALALVQDLIDAVQDEYQSWIDGGREETEGHRGKGSKGKGSGKSKSMGKRHVREVGEEPSS